MVRIALFSLTFALSLAFISHNPATNAAEKPSAKKAAPAKLKGLLVTGGCCHDYEKQKRIITEGLSQRISISWDIIHEGGTRRDHKVSIYQKKNWADGYDVIVHNECFGSIKDDEFVSQMANAHQNSDVAGVFIHCALHSYRSARTGVEAWRELIGVTSTGHEGKRALDVKNINPNHPIMKGFPESWKSPNGELYKITRVWPNCVPLAQAYGKDTKKDHMVAWANQFGRSKVFGTSLGHHNETMNNDVWLGLVSRGVLWSVGKLNDDGTPMPGYEGTGIRPITFGPLQPEPDKKN